MVEIQCKTANRKTWSFCQLFGRFHLCNWWSHHAVTEKIH